MLDIPALLYPSRVAFSVNGSKYTFRDLYRHVVASARALQRLGVKRGDRVGALLYNSIEFLSIFYGCARLGAVFVPLRQSLLPDDWAYIVEDCECVVTFVHGEFLNAFLGTTFGSAQRGATPLRLRPPSDNADRSPASSVNASCRPTRVMHVVQTTGGVAMEGSEPAALAAAWAGVDAWGPLLVGALSRLDRCQGGLVASGGAAAAAAGGEEAVDPAVDGDFGSVATAADPLFTIYTSGTTGRPKGVLASHGSIMHHFPPALFSMVYEAYVGPSGTGTNGDGAREALETFFDKAVAAGGAKPPLGFFEVSLCPKPLSGVAIMMCINSVAFVGELHVLTDFEPRAVVYELMNEGITVSWINAGHFAMLAALPEYPTLSSESFPKLKMVMYGGTHCTEAIQGEMMRLYGPKVGLMQVFGLTETTGAGTALLPPDHEPPETTTETKRKRLRSAGRAGVGCVIRIVDPAARNGHPEEFGAMKPNEVGEVLVGGGHVMTEYWRRDDETAKALVTLPEAGSDVRFMRSGDLGYLDEGGYLFIVGRTRDSINTSKGFTYGTAEVENALGDNPAVAEASVVAVANRTVGGEVGVAFIVPAPGTDLTFSGGRTEPPSVTVEGGTVAVGATGGPLAASAVLGALESRLAKVKHPAHVFVVANLPKNMDGKVVKKPLKEAADAFMDGDGAGAGAGSRL